MAILLYNIQAISVLFLLCFTMVIFYSSYNLLANPRFFSSWTGKYSRNFDHLANFEMKRYKKINHVFIVSWLFWLLSSISKIKSLFGRGCSTSMSDIFSLQLVLSGPKHLWFCWFYFRGFWITFTADFKELNLLMCKP